MKRLLGITLTLASLGVFGLSAEANASESQHSIAATANASPQWQRDPYGRRTYNRRYSNRRRAYTVRRSRVVRYGRRLYRETYLVRYFPSGRTNTRLISRVRIA